MDIIVLTRPSLGKGDGPRNTAIINLTDGQMRHEDLIERAFQVPA
jgi:hypothetical protein